MASARAGAACLKSSQQLANARHACLVQPYPHGPRKWAALLDRVQHWALRVETCQQARREASRSVSAAAHRAAIGRERLQLNTFYDKRPWLKPVRRLPLVTDIDRSDEVREVYAADHPDGADLLDNLVVWFSRFIRVPCTMILTYCQFGPPTRI